MKTRTPKDQAAAAKAKAPDEKMFAAGSPSTQVVVYLIWIVWFAGLWWFVGWVGIAIWLACVAGWCAVGWLTTYWIDNAR